MSLQTLPNDILLDILQQIPHFELSADYYLQKRLYLLHIFQRLRAIALPKIFDHVYIRYSEDEFGISPSYTNKYMRTFAEYIYTNADIIALVNCTHVVKSVTLSVDWFQMDYHGVDNSIKALKACANSWPSITKLDICTDEADFPFENCIIHLIQVHSIDKDFSRELANIMPNVTELLLVNHYDNCAYSEFYSQVTGVYANQLVELSNKYGFDHTDGHRLEAIQYLNIKMGHNNMMLPRVNSHTLVELDIGNIPFNVSWAPFMNSKDDKVVEFPCLKTLSLTFNYIDCIDENMPELLLSFPELSSLDIVCHTEVCPFFSIAMFPKEMEYINIKAPPVLLAQLKNGRMSTAKTLVMHS